MFANDNLNQLPIQPTDNDGFVRVYVVNLNDDKARKEVAEKHADKAGVSTARIRLI